MLHRKSMAPTSSRVSNAGEVNRTTQPISDVDQFSVQPTTGLHDLDHLVRNIPLPCYPFAFAARWHQELMLSSIITFARVALGCSLTGCTARNGIHDADTDNFENWETLTRFWRV